MHNKKITSACLYRVVRYTVSCALHNTYNDTATDGTNKCGGNTFIITHMHAHLYTKMTTNQIQSPVMYDTDSNTPTNSKKIIT